MPDSGLVIAGTGADELGSGPGIWSAPGNLTADDASYASISVSAMGSPASLTSNYLLATNFDFSLLPADAIPDGFEITVERFADLMSGSVVDNSAKLIKGGSISGSDIDTGATWSTSLTTDTLGGPTELGGLSFTRADVVASTFGVAFKCDLISNSMQTIAKIDWVKIKVYYHTLAGDTGTMESPSGPWLVFIHG